MNSRQPDEKPSVKKVETASPFSAFFTRLSRLIFDTPALASLNRNGALRILVKTPFLRSFLGFARPIRAICTSAKAVIPPAARSSRLILFEPTANPPLPLFLYIIIGKTSFLFGIVRVYINIIA